MKYIILAIALIIFGCQEDKSVTPLDQTQMLGNWLVIEETSKSNNSTISADDNGIITTWDGLTYIGALKISDDQSIKLNSFDGSYNSNQIEGTWVINKHSSTITFTISIPNPSISFSKDFRIWVEDGFLFLESSTHLIKHRAID